MRSVFKEIEHHTAIESADVDQSWEADQKFRMKVDKILLTWDFETLTLKKDRGKNVVCTTRVKEASSYYFKCSWPSER